MLLAISANDVAFVSVIVTGITAVVGPLVGWLVAKGGQRHEREIDLSRRNYEARREVYVELSAYMRLMSEVASAVGTARPMPERLPDEERRRLFARVSAFGSDEIVAELVAFSDTFDQTVHNMLWAAEQSSADEVYNPIPRMIRELEAHIREELRR